MNIRELAIYVAGAAHQNQMYGESPYVFHLSAVDAVLEDAGFGEFDAVRIAAWLHDVLEDSELYTREDIEKRFGEQIADIVWRVTNEPAANRKERAKLTYPKIAQHSSSIAVKLADRIANLEQSGRTFSKFGLMYLKEDYEFRRILMTEEDLLHNERMKYLWARYKGAVEKLKEIYGIS